MTMPKAEETFEMAWLKAERKLTAALARAEELEIERDRWCMDQETASAQLTRRQEDGLWCPRCGEVFHDKEVADEPAKFWTCPFCKVVQHQDCRGPLADDSETQALVHESSVLASKLHHVQAERDTRAALELESMEAERDQWCMDWQTACAELLNTRSKLTRVTIQRNLARQGRTEQVERVRFLSKEIARAHPHICYICAHCGDFASTLLDAVDLIDSGTTLVCNRCGMSTVIDLSTPEDRAESYRVAEARGMLGALNAMQK